MASGGRPRPMRSRAGNSSRDAVIDTPQQASNADVDNAAAGAEQPMLSLPCPYCGDRISTSSRCGGSITCLSTRANSRAFRCPCCLARKQAAFGEAVAWLKQIPRAFRTPRRGSDRPTVAPWRAALPRRRGYSRTPAAAARTVRSRCGVHTRAWRFQPQWC
jgi:hypothetical protein